MIVIAPYFIIPPAEIEFTFVRSSGPGGQNVNKVNSKAVLRWNARASAAVPEFLRERLERALKLTQDGDLILTCDTTRDQGRNREECLEKFRALLLAAITPPKVRKKTKPSRSAKRKRREGKTHQAEKKSSRQRVRY